MQKKLAGRCSNYIVFHGQGYIRCTLPHFRVDRCSDLVMEGMDWCPYEPRHSRKRRSWGAEGRRSGKCGLGKPQSLHKRRSPLLHSNVALLQRIRELRSLLRLRFAPPHPPGPNSYATASAQILVRRSSPPRPSSIHKRRVSAHSLLLRPFDAENAVITQVRPSKRE